MLPCLDIIAQHYHVRPAAIERVMRVNRVKPTGIGVMGIPQQDLPLLRNEGFSLNSIATDTCSNITAGAWLLGYAKQLQHNATQSCITNAEEHYVVSNVEVQHILQANLRHPTGYGPMGIPAQWLPILSQVGFNPNAIKSNPCVGLEAGIWILASEEQRLTGGYTGNVLMPPAQLLKEYSSTFISAAQHYHVSPYLLEAVAAQESGFDAQAVSPKGAQGMMQFIPSTAAHYGLTNPFNATESIWAGAHYIHHLMVEFNGNVSLALAGYNAGGQAVKNAGWQIPHFRQTEKYVPEVLERASLLQKNN